MTIAAATRDEALAPVVSAFAAQALSSVKDATAVFRVVYGLDDGNYYGRYAVNQYPLLGFAARNTSVAGLTAQGVSYRAAVQNAIAWTGSVVTDPAQFPLAVLALLGTVRRACANPADALRILASLAGLTVAVNFGIDGLGAEMNRLAADGAVLFRRAAAISLARASADYVPTSQQDAAAVQAQVGDVLDAVAIEAADRFEDASFAALDRLRVAVVNDLQRRGANLAPVVIRELPEPAPAEAIAYRLYGDASRAGDLVARNDPPHPGFLPLQIEALAP